MSEQVAHSSDGTQTRVQTAVPMQQPGNTGVRVHVNSGALRVEGNKGHEPFARSHPLTWPLPPHPFATAKHPTFGMPVSGRNKIAPDTVLTIKGITDKASAFEHMGLLMKDANGVYQIAGKQGDRQEQNKQAREYEPVTIGEQGERQLSAAVAQVGETRALSVAEAISKGGADLEQHITDMAGRTGMEPAQVRAQVEKIQEHFVRAGGRVTGMPSDEYAAFSEWASSKHGSAFTEACRAFVMKADPRGLQSLAKEFQVEQCRLLRGRSTRTRTTAGEGWRVHARRQDDDSPPWTRRHDTAPGDQGRIRFHRVVRPGAQHFRADLDVAPCQPRLCASMPMMTDGYSSCGREPETITVGVLADIITNHENHRTQHGGALILERAVSTPQLFQETRSFRVNPPYPISKYVFNFIP